MCVRRSSLQLDSYCCEQQNLYGSTRSVPERSGDTCKESASILRSYIFAQHTIAISNRSTLQQRSRPRPRRNDRTSHKTRLDRPASRGEHFRSLQFIVVSFENPRRQDLHFISSIFKLHHRRQPTMPSANKNPTPSTMPYPQACPKGDAAGPIGPPPPAIVY
jgi:hypothetical protein